MQRSFEPLIRNIRGGLPSIFGRPGGPIFGRSGARLPFKPRGRLGPPIGRLAPPRGGLKDLLPQKLRDPSAPRPGSFFAQFPDAPRAPRIQTMDRVTYTDPITGEQRTGSGSMASYRRKLKEYLDSNPAAAEAYANRPQAVRPPKPDRNIDVGPIRGGLGDLPLPPPRQEPIIDDLDDRIRPTEIFGPDGQIIGPAGSSADVSGGRVRGPLPVKPISEREDIFGAGKRYDPANLPEGYSFQDTSGMMRSTVMPSQGMVYAYGPDGQQIEVPAGGGDPARRPEGPSPVFGGKPKDEFVPTVNLPPDVQVQDTPPPPVAPVSSVPSADAPFVGGVKQIATGLDPLTEQLLFGIGGKGGFIPGAMRAAEKTFFDAEGNPIVIDEKVAEFSPDQMRAMELQRQAVGIQDPYLQQAAGAYGTGIKSLEEGLQRGRSAAVGSLGATASGVGALQRGLGESADILRGTLGGYDPSMTERFYDPFEDRVVQQTISDVMEKAAVSDIGARAQDIARGGESAFGSRARLGASERQRALGRGVAEALSGIRSQGFREAQQTGLGEFARQKAAERAASSGLAGLAGQGFGGSQALAGALSGLGQTEQDIGQQRMAGQFGLGSSLQGLGAQAAGASASDIASLFGMGSQQQQQAQAMLDAQRRNLQQRQMAPLAQFQALQPFVSMAPAGQFQTVTDFMPKPSALQAGLGAGLSAFGALGQLYGGQKS